MTDRAGMPGNLAVGDVQGDGAPDRMGRDRSSAHVPDPGRSGAQSTGTETGAKGDQAESG